MSFVFCSSLPLNEELLLETYSLIKRGLNIYMLDMFPLSWTFSFDSEKIAVRRNESRSTYGFLYPKKGRLSLEFIHMSRVLSLGKHKTNTITLQMKCIEIILLLHIKAPQLQSTNSFFVNAMCLLRRNQNQDGKKVGIIWFTSLPGMTLLDKYQMEYDLIIIN